MISNLKIMVIPNKGRGVVSLKNFEAGEIVEVCPLIIIPIDTVHPSLINDINPLYNYLWDAGDNKNIVIPLGYGSLYNHSKNPSIKSEIKIDENIMVMTCIKKISCEEEITVSYGTTWFDIVE